MSGGESQFSWKTKDGSDNKQGKMNTYGNIWNILIVIFIQEFAE